MTFSQQLAAAQQNHQNALNSAAATSQAGGLPLFMQPSQAALAAAAAAAAPSASSAAGNPMIHTHTGDHPYLPWPIQQPAVNVPFFDIQAYKGVNLDVPPSEQATGSDLPLNDVATLRFFFNLGVQQSRVVLLNQHLNQHLPQQQQSTAQASASAPPAPMVPPGTPQNALTNQTPTSTPQSQAQPLSGVQLHMAQSQAGSLSEQQLNALAGLLPQNPLLRQQQQNLLAQAQAQAQQLQLAARQPPVPQIDPVTSHSITGAPQMAKPQVPATAPKPGSLEALLLHQALQAAHNPANNRALGNLDAFRMQMLQQGGAGAGGPIPAPAPAPAGLPASFRLNAELQQQQQQFSQAQNQALVAAHQAAAHVAQENMRKLSAAAILGGIPISAASAAALSQRSTPLQQLSRPATAHSGSVAVEDVNASPNLIQVSERHFTEAFKNQNDGNSLAIGIRRPQSDARIDATAPSSSNSNGSPNNPENGEAKPQQNEEDGQPALAPILMMSYLNTCIGKVKNQLHSNGMGLTFDPSGRPIDYASRPIDPIFQSARKQLENQLEYKDATTSSPDGAHASATSANGSPTDRNPAVSMAPLGINRGPSDATVEPKMETRSTPEKRDLVVDDRIEVKDDLDSNHSGHSSPPEKRLRIATDED
ncbi:unnamed protein product, partial [Mesorhabditis spiculigera]